MLSQATEAAPGRHVRGSIGVWSAILVKLSGTLHKRGITFDVWKNGREETRTVFLRVARRARQVQKFAREHVMKPKLGAMTILCL